MKALVVHPGPAFSVADVCSNIVAGLTANGVDVQELNLDRRLDFYSAAHIDRGEGFIKAFDETSGVLMAAKGIEVACYEWWPDVVIIVSGFFVPPEVLAVLARRPHHTVLWCTEAPYEDDRHHRVARYVDTVIVNDPATIDTYRSVNERTWYLPHMWDPLIHASSDAPKSYDFVWVGTAFPSRIEFFEKVDFTGLRVALGGNWQQLPDGHPLEQYIVNRREQCLDNIDTAALYRRAKVSANLYRKEHSDHAHADGHAIGPREVELAAMGTFFLREPRLEGDRLFPDLPTFTTPDEFGQQLRYYVEHDSERETAAQAARLAVADRRNDHVIAGFLRLVDGVGKRNA